MQNRDPLSAFLHTPEWQAHSHATRDDFDNLFTRHAIPAGGSYLLSTRAVIPENWQLPATEKQWFVRIQPDSEASHQNLLKATEQYKHALAHAIQPRETMTLDLTLPEETLLANMKQKHRYNLKIAQREGVQVEHITENAAASMERFWKLLTATSDRHTFRLHTREHYTSILEHLGSKASLAFATHNGEDVAALMLITEGSVATYLHGGSRYEYRSLMAPFLLHWHLITTLKAQGITTYDLWGVHTKDGEALKGHASEGVSRFKLGFGGTLKHYPPTVDVILQPFRYSAYRAIQRFRSRKRAFA